MPLIAQWKDTTTNSIIAIWHIEEPESYFSEYLGFNSDKKNQTRRIEHLAGRFLLKILMPDFPFQDIILSPSGRPYLPNESLKFSISHSYPYIAAIINEENPVGIDIQKYQEKIVRLQDKFLSPIEQEICNNDITDITLAWTAKEAAFKWYALGEVDFINHMPINKIEWEDQKATILMHFIKNNNQLKLEGGKGDQFAWSKVG